MNKIIVISGPTASGKTKMAVDFCKKNNGEIISCDSRQVYKYLDIGSNKEGSLIDEGCREIDGIKQYLVDIIEPNMIYSAADFVRDADIKIGEIISRKKLPVITGGTGLYIKALLYGLDKMPTSNAKLRDKLSKQSHLQLYESLLDLDKEAAIKNKDNPQRLLRALEVNILSGKTMSAHFKEKKPRYNFKHYSIKRNISELYDKINKRTVFMLNNGMIEETLKVLNMGFKRDCPAFSGVGYRDVLKFIDGLISKENLIENISKDCRHYAKRQNTWFRNQPDIEFQCSVKKGRTCR
jgi:tRNA dimethylallyltransferase